jgi:hypothetical protein
MFLVVGGAVIAGLVLGGAFLMLRPSADPLADAVVPEAPAATAQGAQAGPAEADPGEPEADPVVEEGSTKPAGPKQVRLTSRDPFASIVVKAPPAPQKVTAEPAEPAAAPKAASGGVISALTISPLGNSVKLKLDGKKYTVDEGEAFAKSYRLYDIFNANCAGFLYGDQNAVVCEGDSVTIG